MFSVDLFGLAHPAKPETQRQTSAFQVLVKRSQHRLIVFDKQGREVLTTPVGIGSGGNTEKKNMNDCVTPTGNFVVDIILYHNDEFDETAEAVKERYRRDPRKVLIDNRAGLKRLFANMNSLDFNGDSEPDTAYGIAYLGLDSGDQVTGPKLSRFKNTDYWFSIAIHGTADEKDKIGHSRSGGCIQVPAKALRQLVEKKLIIIGTPVKIE